MRNRTRMEAFHVQKEYTKEERIGVFNDNNNTIRPFRFKIQTPDTQHRIFSAVMRG